MPETSCERMDHPAATTSSCQTSVRSACPYMKLLAIGVSPALSRLPGIPRCTLKLMKDAVGAADPPDPPSRSAPPPGRQLRPPQPGQSRPRPGPPQPGVLPPPLAAALAAFERHLRSERSLSPHTVRAYA